MVCVCSTLANLISACATSPIVRMHTHTRCDAEALPGPPTCCLQPACLSSCSTSLPPPCSVPGSPRRPPGAGTLCRQPWGPGTRCLRPPAPSSACHGHRRHRAGLTAHPSESPRAIPAGSRGRILPALQWARSHRSGTEGHRGRAAWVPNQIPYPIWGNWHWTLQLQHIPLHRTPTRCQQVKVL